MTANDPAGSQRGPDDDGPSFPALVVETEKLAAALGMVAQLPARPRRVAMGITNLLGTRDSLQPELLLHTYSEFQSTIF
jgi:hypothetical protein